MFNLFLMWSAIAAANFALGNVLIGSACVLLQIGTGLAALVEVMDDEE